MIGKKGYPGTLKPSLVISVLFLNLRIPNETKVNANKVPKLTRLANWSTEKNAAPNEMIMVTAIKAFCGELCFLSSLLKVDGYNPSRAIA